MSKKTMTSRAENIKKRSEAGEENSNAGLSSFNMMGPRRGFDGPTMQAPDTLTLGETEKYTTRYLDIINIFDNTNNRFDVKDTTYLEGSIERLGQLQPIVVVRKLDEKNEINGVAKPYYEVKAGSRRFKAIQNLHQRALNEKDLEKAEKFSKVFAVILPAGATEKEIEDVITETNTTARQVSISDMFKNFDFIFEKDSKGNYIKFPNVKSDKINVIDTVVEVFNGMGYSYSKASIKDYWSIYQKCIRPFQHLLVNGQVAKRDCLLIKKMDVEAQEHLYYELNHYEEDRRLELNKEIEKKQKKQGYSFNEITFEKKFNKETERKKRKKIKEYVEEYLKDREGIEDYANSVKSVTGGHFRGDLLNLSNKISKIKEVNEIIFINEHDRTATLNMIESLKEDIEKLADIIEEQKIY